jgi:hypothetical protein
MLTGPLHGGERRRAPVSRGSGPWGALRAGDRLRFEERVFTMTGLGHDGPVLGDRRGPCWCCFHTLMASARHLIADRLGLAGANWGLAGALLKLRALATSGDLGTCW